MAGRVGRPLKAETLARLGGQNIEVNPNAKINPITQKEILHEFNCNKYSMNKGTLSHKLNGKRDISIEELEIILRRL